MQKHIERVRRPSPDFLEPIESASMMKKSKEVGTIVKLKNQTYSLETAVASPNSIKCCMNLEPLPKNAKTSMFVILSLLYGKLLVVACIAFVVSYEITKCLPVSYYEAFFSFLFVGSIGFLKFVFFCLLQDSNCCPGNRIKDERNAKKKAKNGTKKKKEKSKSKGSTDSPQISTQSTRPRPSVLQREIYPRKIKDLTKSKEDMERIECSADTSTDSEEITSSVGVGTTTRGKIGDEKQIESRDDSIDVELSSPEIEYRRRKTSQNTAHYGSFFLRVGTVAFGLGTMVYTGLQFGRISETPVGSTCFELLEYLNPFLQAVFIFMQMHFLFMNARLKIHRFKFIARLGLMHIVATNICVWIKTVVRESLNGIGRKPILYLNFSSNIVDTLANEYNMMNGTNIFHAEKSAPNVERPLNRIVETTTNATGLLYEQRNVTAGPISRILTEMTTATSNTTSLLNETFKTTTVSTFNGVSSITPIFNNLIENNIGMSANELASVNVFNHPEPSHSISDFNVTAQAFSQYQNNSCGRLNIMGTLVEDLTPFLYPFVVQYSLICAAVIFVIWRRTSRYPRQLNEVDLEHKLETILNRRAAAMAHAQNGSRVDCVGANKGLFFGLLSLVGTLICMLLFFVLIHHRQFSWLAVYLADVSHSLILALSILAILIGVCRARKLKFNITQPTDLNDILLRVSAFGLLTYATFGVIAGGRYAYIKEQHLLVLITGSITIIQVVLQLLFINDMSKRHVHQDDQDRNKPGRQVVTFLLLCNITMCVLFVFESQKVLSNPVQLEFYGESAWKLIETVTLPLCIFHRFHSAVALTEIWKNTYKPRID